LALSSYEEKEELFKAQVGVYEIYIAKFGLISDCAMIIPNSKSFFFRKVSELIDRFEHSIAKFGRRLVYMKSILQNLGSTCLSSLILSPIL
jgi:hypothetical protein